MTSSKTAGTWADLQESLTRVRQNYGILSRAEWDNLLTRTSNENSILEKSRHKKSKPFLPSLDTSSLRRDGSTSSDLFRRTNKQQIEILLKQQDSKKIYKQDPIPMAPKVNPFTMGVCIGPQGIYFNHLLLMSLTDLSGITTPELYSRTLMEDLVAEVLHSESVDVVRSTVREFVDNHLLYTAVHDCVDETITSIIQTEFPLMMQEIKEEIQSDNIYNNLTHNVIVGELKDVVSAVFSEYDDQLNNLQQDQITLSANKYLIDMFLLEHLSGMVGVNKPGIFGKDQSQILLDSFMLDNLLTQHLSIHQARQSVFRNYPMRRFHQKAFSNVVLEMVLQELNMNIDEDMEDILEYERDIEIGTDHSNLLIV
ncbi:uncharacterized protein O3C94_014414 [Discoglossus pictus]